MRGNDLSNRVVPRDVVVWEGLVGVIPDVKIAAQEAKFRKKSKWTRAVACYEINELLARKVWQVTWQGSLQLDLLTYHGPEFAEALEARMDRENMPFSRVWSEEPARLARSLATMVDIRTIYDPFPDHRFLYGGKGQILTPDTAHFYLGA